VPTRKPLAPITPVPTGRTQLLAPTGPARLENARHLSIQDIRENPQQARQHFDETALDELAESIRQHGIMQPIVVRPDGEIYVIIAGERRWRAAILAGLQFVPAIIRDELTEDEALILTALENLQRQDLTIGDEGRMYQSLKRHIPPPSSRERDTEGHISNRALGRLLGLAPSRIDRALRLLDHPALLEQVESGQVTLEDAVAQIGAESDGPTELLDRSTLDAEVRQADADRQVRQANADRRGLPWRAITRTYRLLGRLQPQDVPLDECADLAQQLADLETQVATARRALEARLQAEGPVPA
jgi:ParB family chromosome partitioning protein